MMEIEINGRTLDISTDTGRLVAADAAQEAEREHDAELLRERDRHGRLNPIRVVDGVIVPWVEPLFRTTIHQVDDEDDRGLRMTRRVVVVTDYSDYANDPWSCNDNEQREWWEDFLQSVHDVRVEIAGARSSIREMYAELFRYEYDDIDDLPDVMRRTLAHAEAAVNEQD